MQVKVFYWKRALVDYEGLAEPCFDACLEYRGRMVVDRSVYDRALSCCTMENEPGWLAPANFKIFNMIFFRDLQSVFALWTFVLEL